MTDYHLICGLEIHTELKTKSKMFCSCHNDPFGAPAPNCYTCPVCLGMPGGLPVANQKAIEWTIKLGLFLGCKINCQSKFDRKNYFYPDLPKGYQISQYDLPFCYDGVVETSEGPVRITRIHLEEDTAKLIHSTLDGKEVTLVDFNRSSVPLVEIVSEPDIKSAQQAKEYAQKIREAVRFLGIGDADMEKGGMRLEANISLQTDQQQQQGKLPDYKVEVKNINSFNYMAQAVEFEIERQSELLAAGKKIPQETRGWSSVHNHTFVQRSKENAADYRYFPDPDLPTFNFSTEQIELWRAELPLTSDKILAEWQEKFGLSSKYGKSFIDNPETITWATDLWTQALAQKISVEKLANFMINKKLSYQRGEASAKIIDRYQQLTQIDQTDDTELVGIIQQVFAAHSAEKDRLKNGEQKLIGFFMGQIMRQAGKKLDPAQVSKLIQAQL